MYAMTAMILSSYYFVRLMYIIFGKIDFYNLLYFYLIQFTLNHYKQIVTLFFIYFRFLCKFIIFYNNKYSQSKF